MGFLSWLRGERPPQQTPVIAENTVTLKGDGLFKLQIVGESHYQASSRGDCRKKRAKAYREYLRMHGFGRIVGTCDAHVRGEWAGSANRGHFGVWLDFPLYG